MPFGIPKGARCVQRFDDSLNSAIHITYRISLRSSSMREPRDPLLKVVLTFSIPWDRTFYKTCIKWFVCYIYTDSKANTTRAPHLQINLSPADGPTTTMLILQDACASPLRNAHTIKSAQGLIERNERTCTMRASASTIR